MTTGSGTLTVPDFSQAQKKLKALTDTSDGTTNPAHPLLNAAAEFINPATAENQATGNSALASIANNTTLGSLNFTVPLTVTAGAYTAGRVVGGKITVPNAARAPGGGGIIQQALIGKKTTLTAAFDLFVFHTNPTASFNDNQALPDISADLGKLAGVIHCLDIIDCGTPQILQALQQALQFEAAVGSTAIYIVPVVRGSETYASTSAVTLSLGILQD